MQINFILGLGIKAHAFVRVVEFEGFTYFSVCFNFELKQQLRRMNLLGAVSVSVSIHDKSFNLIVSV